MLIDDKEYVCEGCGTIYDISALKFISSELTITDELKRNVDKVSDELDAIIESVIPSKHGRIKKRLSSHPKAEYCCPNCDSHIVMPDRRCRIEDILKPTKKEDKYHKISSSFML